MSKSPEHTIFIEEQDEHQIITDTLKANVTVAPLYEGLKNSMTEAKISPKDTKPKIQRVPVVLREQMKFGKHYQLPSIGPTKFEKSYEPLWISVGPIHHGKAKLMLAEEKYKPELVVKFINDSGLEIEALYKIIKDKIEELKKCFDEDVIKDYDDDTLCWMLFFDGCSTLQFISSYVNDELKKLFWIKNDQVAFAQRDLFLLENQIPFLVLKLLMECRNDVAALKNSVEKFIHMNVMTPENYKKNLETKIGTDPEATHLLELLWLAILEQPKKHWDLKEILTDFWPFKLREENDIGTFRSIQELKKAGIDFKPSESCSLTDITFKSSFFTGLLHLPPLVVDESTATTFVNLIAYENCHDNFRTRYEVTSYISFLDSLINHANDVKELRSTQILHNRLGSDEEVASLFNEIGTDLVPNNEIYEDVRSNVMKYYKSKWMIKLAETYHDHFSSPSWTVLAFFGALLGLALSAIQTWFVVFPPSDPNHSCQH